MLAQEPQRLRRRHVVPLHQHLHFRPPVHEERVLRRRRRLRRVLPLQRRVPAADAPDAASARQPRRRDVPAAVGVSRGHVRDGRSVGLLRRLRQPLREPCAGRRPREHVAEGGGRRLLVRAGGGRVGVGGVRLVLRRLRRRCRRLAVDGQRLLQLAHLLPVEGVGAAPPVPVGQQRQDADERQQHAEPPQADSFVFELHARLRDGRRLAARARRRLRQGHGFTRTVADAHGLAERRRQRIRRGAGGRGRRNRRLVHLGRPRPHARIRLVLAHVAVLGVAVRRAQLASVCAAVRRDVLLRQRAGDERARPVLARVAVGEPLRHVCGEGQGVDPAPLGQRGRSYILPRTHPGHHYAVEQRPHRLRLHEVVKRRQLSLWVAADVLARGGDELRRVGEQLVARERRRLEQPVRCVAADARLGEVRAHVRQLLLALSLAHHGCPVGEGRRRVVALLGTRRKTATDHPAVSSRLDVRARRRPRGRGHRRVRADRVRPHPPLAHARVPHAHPELAVLVGEPAQVLLHLRVLHGVHDSAGAQGLADVRAPRPRVVAAPHAARAGVEGPAGVARLAAGCDAGLQQQQQRQGEEAGKRRRERCTHAATAALYSHRNRRRREKQRRKRKKKTSFFFRSSPLHTPSFFFNEVQIL
eukprot:Rhum_TRINITY_DN4203_c0_g1::Rhum_TRINITY_DN4203_c0_g1_i1::g.13376::m.13376